MKALVISMLILLIAFFGLIPALGQMPENKSPQPIKQEEKPAKEPEHKEKTADANAIADPNAVRTKIKEFEGLGEALEKINAESSSEISEWTRGRLDDRLDLALAMQKQITAEFKFLRELAVKEGAVQTTAAIDGILLDRQERSKGVIEELEKKSERLHRRAEREEKKTKEQERSRERSKEGVGRSRKDTQP
ncbi:MAG: OadG family protein [Sedimentisphaerales bacterium]